MAASARLVAYGIFSALLLTSCVSDQEIKEIGDRVTTVENRQTVSREVVGELVSIQKKLVEGQRNTEQVMEIMLKNQADIKDNMDSMFNEISKVVGRLEEDVYQSKAVSDNIKKLLRFFKGKSGNRFKEIELSIMESNLQNALALRLLSIEMEKSLEKMDALLEIKTEKEPSPEPEKEIEKIVTVSETLSAEELYNSAYENFRKGSYAQAEAEFSAYVERYPDDDLSDNSQYWYAEAIAGQGKDEEAADAFVQVAERYPKSTKASKALWRSAGLYEKLGRGEDAAQVLGEIVENYPNSPEAIKAKKKLKSKK